MAVVSSQKADSFRMHFGDEPKEIVRVCLVRVARLSGSHHMEDWTVDVLLSTSASVAEHDARPAWSDAVRDLVYSVARGSIDATLELFAMKLAESLLRELPQLPSVEVHVQSHLWRRLTIDGQFHPTAFMKGSDERQTTTVSGAQNGNLRVQSGFQDMTLLQTALPAVESSQPDQFDNGGLGNGLSATTLCAEWVYRTAIFGQPGTFQDTRRTIRETAIAAFAQHLPRSLEDTASIVAKAARNSSPALQKLRLSLQQRHYELAELSELAQADGEPFLFVPAENVGSPQGRVEIMLESAEQF